MHVICEPQPKGASRHVFDNEKQLKKMNSTVFEIFANITLIKQDAVTECTACDLSNLTQSNQSL